MKTKHKTRQLGEEPIGKLLYSLSMPAIAGMVVMAMYNVVDTIFVGHGVGAMAIGGMAIVFPVQMIVMAVAQTIGLGGGSIISRSLGAKNIDKANNTYGNLISLIVIVSILLTALMFWKINEVLILFGATGEILPYAYDYFSITLIGLPFISWAMTANNIIRAEGNTFDAMMTMIVSAVLNVILDPIFIFGFNMGIAGAAIATVIAQIAAFVYAALYFIRGRSSLTLYRHNLKFNREIVRETLAIGASSFVRQISNSVIIIILNRSLITFGGEIAVAVYGVINRIVSLFFMAIFGIAQGFLPIAGYNFGAQHYKRVLEVIRLSIISTTVISVFGFLISMLFPAQLVAIFSTDSELIGMGAHAMRLILIATPLIGFQVITASLFQALGRALPSLFLSLVRQVILLIPIVLILPVFWGLDGIWISFPIADFFAAIITAYMLWGQLNILKQKITESSII